MQVWSTPPIAMKLPFATPSSSRRPSEAGSQTLSSDPEAAEHPWGVVLGQLATVARHDPRAEVSFILLINYALEDFAVPGHQVHCVHWPRRHCYTMPLTLPNRHAAHAFVMCLHASAICNRFEAAEHPFRIALGQCTMHQQETRVSMIQL